jgi:hypothetical protein
VEKILKLAGRGTDIAWEKCGRPGTWGNIAPLEGRRSQQARWRRRRGRIITARRCHACTRHRGWARGYHDLCFAHRVAAAACWAAQRLVICVFAAPRAQQLNVLVMVLVRYCDEPGSSIMYSTSLLHISLASIDMQSRVYTEAISQDHTTHSPRRPLRIADTAYRTDDTRDRVEIESILHIDITDIEDPTSRARRLRCVDIQNARACRETHKWPLTVSRSAPAPNDIGCSSQSSMDPLCAAGHREAPFESFAAIPGVLDIYATHSTRSRCRTRG